MPFVSGKESRELTQGLTPYDSSTAATDFGEVFAASLGQVIDEDLTISHSLNRAGREERRSLTAEAINTDQVDRHKYMDRRGKFDYDRLAQEMPELGLKSDQVLADERNALLAQRRGYAQDVIERGSGIAQFLGAANAYMLDPVNIATIGVATASVSAKSLSVLGRALMVGRNEAALNAASELMIQPFVYGHKQEIDSPYAASDAIKNIAFAAAGGAVFGSAVGGISGIIGKSSNASKGVEPNIVARDTQEPDSLAGGVDVPDVVDAPINGSTVGGISGYLSKAIKSAETLDIVTPDVEQSLQYLSRMRDTVNDATYPKIRQVDESNPYLFEMDTAVLKSTEYEGIKVDPSKIKGKVKKPITATYSDGEFKVLDGHHRVAAAVRDGDTIKALFIPESKYLEMQGKGIHQGEMLQEFLAKDVDRSISPVVDVNKYDIEQQSKYLNDLEARKVEANKPSKTPSDYFEPPKAKPKKAMGTDREREILKRTGIDEDFDADMAAYSRIENPAIIKDGEMVEASSFMKELDDEIGGIESVLVCARG